MKMKFYQITSVIITIAILISAAFGVGAYTGMRWQTQREQNYISMMAFARAAYAHSKYLNAEYPYAKSALLNYAAYLEKRVSNGAEESLFGTEYFDLAITYARLALLEEKQGNISAFYHYMEQSGRLKAEQSMPTSHAAKSTQYP